MQFSVEKKTDYQPLTQLMPLKFNLALRNDQITISFSTKFSSDDLNLGRGGGKQEEIPQ